jgi:hypothetical protein
LSRSWRALERKLKQADRPRAAHECISHYAERVGRARPELAATLAALARRYLQLRYGATASDAQRTQFRRAVRRLRVPAHRHG